MATIAKVSGLSKSVTEKELTEFFGHSGKISRVEITNLEGEDLRIGFVTFEEGEALQSALLLSGSELEGRKILVDAAEEIGENGADGEGEREGEGEAQAETRPTTDVAPGSLQQRAQRMVAELLGAGHVLGARAMLHARDLDERHQIASSTKSTLSAFGIATKEFASKTSSRASDVDRRMRISESIAHGVEAVNQKVAEVDDKYSLSDKTRGIFERAEKVVSGAISAGQKKGAESSHAVTHSSYWERGHTWVVGAVASLSVRGNKEGEGEGVPRREEKGGEELKVQDKEARLEGEIEKGEDMKGGGVKGEEVQGEEVKKKEEEQTADK